MEDRKVNPKLKLVLMGPALLCLIVGGARMAHLNARPQRTAQTSRSKSAANSTDANKNTSVFDCSLLTPAMIEKALGHPFQADPPHKTMPMYSGAWGWSSHYFSLDQRSATIDFTVYAEKSAAKAKQDFDTLSIGADSSAGKPSIGDSSYWFTSDKQEPFLFVLKGKVHFSLGMIPANEKQTKDLAAAVAAGI